MKNKQVQPTGESQHIYGRMGFTTGACAAAAAKAAVQAMLGTPEHETSMEIPFPGGERHELPVEHTLLTENGAEAAVRKDAGDDPDITHGSLVLATVEWTMGDDIVYSAGEGVGTVTKKGLSVPPGEPAINPVARKMIRDAVRELTARSVRVTVSIPGGEELAGKTSNARLGIANGLSVLGTTGRVRPFSCEALKCSLVCQLDVAAAAGVSALVMVPGHIGEKSASRHLELADEQIIEVGNDWGFVLERLSRYSFEQVLIWGHPGKLVKLADGQWDTHSSRSTLAVDILRRMDTVFRSIDFAEHPTTEGLFAALDPAERARTAGDLSAAIARMVQDKTGGGLTTSVVLVNMEGDILGSYGDILTWQ